MTASKTGTFTATPKKRVRRQSCCSTTSPMAAMPTPAARIHADQARTARAEPIANGSISANTNGWTKTAHNPAKKAIGACR